MIGQIEITVYPENGNTTTLDLTGVDTLSLNLQFSSISDFAARGTFSRDFQIPATASNKLALGFAHDWNEVSIQGFTRKVRTTIAVDSIPYKSGYIQIKSAVYSNGVPDLISIVFYADAPDLAKTIGEKKLSELSQLATLNHNVDYDSVQVDTDNYIWTLCDRGQKWSNEGQAGSRPVNNGIVPVYPADLTPAVSWRWIFVQILSDAGFTPVAATILTALETYWMPWLNTQNVKPDVGPGGFFFRADLDADTTTPIAEFAGGSLASDLAEVFDNNSDFATGQYTVPYTGNYTFRVWGTFERTLFTGIQEVSLLFSITGTAPTTVGGVSAIFGGPITDDEQHSQAIVTMLLHAGDILTMNYVSNGEMIIKSDFGNYETGTGFELIDISSPMFDFTIGMAQNAPDMKQIDFIRDVIKMHNALVIPNNDGSISFIPFAEYIASGATHDWTSKIVLDKDIVVRPTSDEQKAKLKWSYSQGGDVGSSLYTNIGRTYGQYEVNGYQTFAGAERNDFADGDGNIILTTRSTPCIEIDGTSKPIPKFVSGDGAFVAPGPRCLYNAGTMLIMLWDEDLDQAFKTPINILNHYSELNANVVDYDLNFAPETPLHLITANPSNNLFNLWWRRSLAEIYSPEARIMEAYFDLNLSDVTTLQFKDVIWIGGVGVAGAYWRVMSIDDYNMAGRDVTKVVLMKIINRVEDCQYQVYNIDSAGFITFINAAEEVSAGSETCCLRYGYDWTGTACRARGIQNVNIRSLINQGLTGIGFQNAVSQRTNNLRSFILGTSINVATDVRDSIIAGRSVHMQQGNRSIAAIGNNISADENLRSVQIFGTNARAMFAGIHFGGGFYADSPSSPVGRAQHGIIPMSGEGNFTSAGAELELYIDGVTNARLNLTDDSVMKLQVEVAIMQYRAGVVDDVGHLSYDVVIYKSAGVALFTGSNLISRSVFTNATLEIDVTTDTSQHRLKVKSTGSNHNGIKLSASVRYVQVTTT